MLLLAIVTFSLNATAQISLSPNLSLSYTGLHWSGTVQVNKGNFAFYAGPKLLLTQSASLKGPWGLDAGLNYYLPAAGSKLRSYVNISYLNTFSVSRTGSDGVKPRGQLHEYGIGYGLQWNAGNKISIYNQLLVGRYTEYHYLSGSQDAYTYSGFNTLLKVGATYRLQK